MPGIGRSRRRNLNRRKRSRTAGNNGKRLVGIEVPIEVTPEQQSKRQKKLLVKGKLNELYKVNAKLGSTKRRLKSRTSEAEDLRSQLEAYEHRLSTVELQRELYKAEAEIPKKNLDAFLANPLEYRNDETPVSSHLTMEDLPEEDSLTTVETPRRLLKGKNQDGERRRWELNPTACVTPDNSPLHQSSPNEQTRSTDSEIPPSASPTASRHRHFNIFRTKSRSSGRSLNNNRSESIRWKLPSFRLKKHSSRNVENTNSPEVDRLIDRVDRLSMLHRYNINSVNSVQKHIVDLNTARGHERQKPMTPNESNTNQDRSLEAFPKKMSIIGKSKITQITQTIPSSLMDDSDSELSFCLMDDSGSEPSFC